MENKEKLIANIQKLAIEGHINILKLDWTEQFNIDLHDYIVKFKYENTTYEGRGTDPDEDTAIIKAYAEAVERYVVFKYEINSTNGCAVHTSLLNSKLNAKKELIERDLFSIYFLFNLNRNKIENPIGNQSIKNLIFSRKDKIIQYQIFSDFYVTMTLILSNDGFIAGLGCDQDSEKSADHSLIEATRQYVHGVIFNNKTEIGLDKFYKKSDLSFKDHGNLAFNNDYIQKIRRHFSAKQQTPPNLMYTEKEFKFIEFNDQLLTDSGLYFTQCQNPSLIDLPLADYELTEIQQARMCSLGLNDSNRTILPHFIR